MLGEYEKLSREAAEADEPYEGYLLRLSELELTTRSGNALAARVKAAGFPVIKELADFDFTLLPNVSKPKVLELSRCEWVEQNMNACWVGNSGTGKTHLCIALGLCACRAGKRVKFTTAASLANQLEEAQKQYRLERSLKQIEKVDLLIIDELGYLSFSRTAAELLCQASRKCGSSAHSMIQLQRWRAASFSTADHGPRASTRMRRRSKFARPYILRLISLIRLTCPWARPLFHDISTAGFTESQSRSNPCANARISAGVVESLARAIHCRSGSDPPSAIACLN